jgi:hypothetical protein
MSTKYIHDSLLLTKEAFNDYILKQQSIQAASFGLNQQAIIDGSVVQSSLQSGSL